jgi:twinkle protein
MSYDIKQISEMLAKRAQDVCEWLLPNGKRRAQEWCVGGVHGEAGDSMRVNLGGKAGLWKDFADQEKGGDLIDLIMAVHSCGKAEAVQSAKDFLGIRDDKPSFVTKPRAYKMPEKPRALTKPKSDLLQYFAERGISPTTLTAYRVGEVNGKHGSTIVFPYFHDDSLKFIKFRPIADKHAMFTSAESEPILFGWQAYPSNARAVLITEGEIDAMTFYEQGIAALSVPRGAGKGEQQDAWIAAEWDRLELFDTIYLAMDSDDQGKIAQAQIIERLGRERCFVLDFSPHKDANEAHLAGVQLQSILDKARTCDPEELRCAADYLADIADYFDNGTTLEGETLPWSKSWDKVRLRTHEVSVWAGINGHGKSNVLGHVMVNSAIEHNTRWCVASMEFRPVKFLARISRQIVGVVRPTRPQVYEVLPDPLANVFIFNVQGTAKAEKILEVFQYAHRRYGCTQFVIDSLAKCGFAEDDYAKQKGFVDQCAEWALKSGVHVHIVVHARKGESEEKMPEKFDIKGTGAITDMVDNVFVIWRNKVKERIISESNGVPTNKALEAQSKHDCIINCCKQRNGEWEGKLGLFFDKFSLRYTEEN